MNDRERFKIAVLSLCADQGLSPGETLVLVKQAQGPAAGALAARSAIGAAAGTAKTVLPWLADKALWGLLLAPAAAGSVGGWGAAKLTSGMNDRSPQEIKNQELIDEYRRQAAIVAANREHNQRKQRGEQAFRGRGLL